MAKLDGKICAHFRRHFSGIGAETAQTVPIRRGDGDRHRLQPEIRWTRPRRTCRAIEVLVSNAGDIAATKALVEQVKAKHGRIDVLFVNAGDRQVRTDRAHRTKPFSTASSM